MHNRLFQVISQSLSAYADRWHERFCTLCDTSRRATPTQIYAFLKDIASQDGQARVAATQEMRTAMLQVLDNDVSGA